MAIPQYSEFEKSISQLRRRLARMPERVDFPLLDKPIEKIDAFDKNTNSLLTYGSWAGTYKEVKLFLGMSSNEIVLSSNRSNENVIHSAVRYNNVNALKALLEDDRTKILLSQKNLYGQTPIDIAFLQGSDDIKKILTQNISPPKTLPNTTTNQLNQLRLNTILTEYLHSKGLKTNIIDPHGNCHGWAFLYEIFASNKKEKEFYDILKVISQLDLKDIEKTPISEKLLKEYGSVSSMLDHIIDNLVVFHHGSETGIKDLELGFTQYSRVEQYELVKDETLNRQIKQLGTFNGLSVNKDQLTEMFDYFSSFPNSCVDLNLSLKEQGHTTALYIDNDGKLSYYDSNLNEKVFFDSSAELADHLYKYYFRFFDVIKKDDTVIIGFLVSKFYDQNQIIPRYETPKKSPFSPQNKCGFTPLHQAVMNNNFKEVETLIKNKVNLDAYDSLGKTPLHWAVELGNFEIVQNLVRAGSDPNKPDKRKETPILIALKNENMEMVRHLSNLGAKDNAHLSISHRLVTNKYDENVLFYFIEKEANKNKTDAHGNTVLHYAILRGSNKTSIVTQLVKNGADINLKNKAGSTPLMLAIKNNENLKLIHNLIGNGADVNLKCNGISPLSVAIFEGNNDLAMLLINKGADVNSIEANGLTPLHLCATKMQISKKVLANVNRRLENPNQVVKNSPDQLWVPIHSKVVNGLIKAGANINEKSAEDDRTPLINAILKTNYAVAKFLIQQPNVDVNLIDKYGNSALLYAIHNKNTELVKLLLNKGADYRSENEESPWSKAIEMGNIEIIKLLLTKTSKEDKAILYATLLLENTTDSAILNVFSDAKVSLNTIVNGRTVFSLSLPDIEDDQTIRRLIAAGANAYIKNPDGTTPLGIAKEENNIAFNFLSQNAPSKKIPPSNTFQKEVSTLSSTEGRPNPSEGARRAPGPNPNEGTRKVPGPHPNEGARRVPGPNPNEGTRRVPGPNPREGARRVPGPNPNEGARRVPGPIPNEGTRRVPVPGPNPNEGARRAPGPNQGARRTPVLFKSPQENLPKQPQIQPDEKKGAPPPTPTKKR